MRFDEIYANQVELLLDVAPIVSQFECFAIKGGTAINLYIQNMPRLSVDIDLAYLPVESREVFLNNINSEMSKMAQIIEMNQFRVEKKPSSKLMIYNSQASIKIEPNLVIRGSAFDCENHDLCQRAQDQFFKYSRVKTLSFADLYGGKICAALARHHPRDLFDVKFLLDNQGLTDNVRQAFIVYLASSPRPMSELLSPSINIAEFKNTFEQGFIGMTDIRISYEELIEVFHVLTHLILENLTTEERKFILSIKSGNPEWNLMPIPGIDKLPAIQWKITNINKMTREKQKDAFEKLKSILKM